MTATERINALLLRAGRPALRALDPERDAPGRLMDFTENMDAIVEAEHGGSRIRYIRHLVDVIDQLENALEDVRAERDEMLLQTRILCGMCNYLDKNLDLGPYGVCKKCQYNGIKCAWQRGMPGEEITTCRESQ